MGEVGEMIEWFGGLFESFLYHCKSNKERHPNISSSSKDRVVPIANI